jgi:hypothetical protein
VDFHLVHEAVIGEDHEISMRRSDKEMLNVVFVLRHRAKAAFAPATLALISGDRRAFYVATLGDGDGDIFVGN